MSHSYKPMHYSAAGILMMSDMFEQQMRIANAMGEVALATSPFFLRSSYSAATPRKTATTSQPAKAVTFARTYSMPV